jgi:hypothetical protein
MQIGKVAVVPAQYVPYAGYLDLSQWGLDFTQCHVAVEYPRTALEFIFLDSVNVLRFYPWSEHLNVGYFACA